MNIVLVPIGGVMLIVLVFIFKSISEKNKYKKAITILITLLFLLSFIAICIYMPNVNYR